MIPGNIAEKLDEALGSLVCWEMSLPTAEMAFRSPSHPNHDPLSTAGSGAVDLPGLLTL